MTEEKKNKNRILDESGSDFASPIVFKKFKSNVPKSPKNKSKKPKRKKQVTLHQIIKDNFQYSDMNPDHLQMALALSKSKYELETPCSQEEEIPSLPAPKHEATRTLLEFGFKSNRPRANLRDCNYQKNLPSLNKKSKFRFITPILLMRTEQERQSLIEKKLSAILSESIEENFLSYKKYDSGVFSEELMKLNCSECPLFHSSYQDRESFKVPDLNILVTEGKCGSLLKDWRKIPCRDPTPERQREILDPTNGMEVIIDDSIESKKEISSEKLIHECDDLTPERDVEISLTNKMEMEFIINDPIESEKKILEEKLIDQYDEMFKLGESTLNDLKNISNKSFGIIKDSEENILNESNAIDQLQFVKENSHKKFETYIPTSPDLFEQTLHSALPKHNTVKAKEDLQHRFIEKQNSSFVENQKNSGLYLPDTSIVKSNNSLSQIILNDLHESDHNNTGCEIYISSSDEEIETFSEKNLKLSPEIDAIKKRDKNNSSRRNESNQKLFIDSINLSSYSDTETSDKDIFDSNIDEQLKITGDVNLTMKEEHSLLDNYIRISPELEEKNEGRFLNSKKHTEEVSEDSFDEVQLSSNLESCPSDKFKTSIKLTEDTKNLSKELKNLMENSFGKNEKIDFESFDDIIYVSDDELNYSCVTRNNNIIINDEWKNSETACATPLRKFSSFTETNSSSRQSLERNKSDSNIVSSKKSNVKKNTTLVTHFGHLNTTELSNVSCSTKKGRLDQISKETIQTKISADNFERVSGTPLGRFSSFSGISSSKTKNYFGRNKSDSNITPTREFTVKTKDVTPMTNFEALNTPELIRELDKFGLKPLKRKRGINLLKHIYEATHPIVKRRDVDEETQEKALKKFKKNDILDIPTGGRMSMETCDISESDAIVERKRSTKIHSCQVPLQIAWLNLINDNPKLLEKVLLFEPLQLEIIHSMLKEQGFKFHSEDLITFLDQKCITIRIAQNKNKVSNIT